MKNQKGKSPSIPLYQKGGYRKREIKEVGVTGEREN